MRRRLLHLALGLPLYGIGAGLTIEAGLGVDPWTVFAQGVALHTGIGIGWLTNIIGLLLLLLWIPLRQRPGVGTVANILLVGTFIQATVDLVPPVEALAPRILLLGAGIVLVAVASGIYLGARLGAGPRDGLMMGIRERCGWPLWLARGTVELTVLTIGWLLGGNVGIGTIVFAAAIGPLVHVTVPLFAIRPRPVRGRRRNDRDILKDATPRSSVDRAGAF